MKKQDYDYLLEIIKKDVGWQLDSKSFYMVDKKISNFIRTKSFLNADELVAEIKAGNKLLFEQLIEELTNSETHFFRDYEVFSRFSNIVLPNIKNGEKNNKKLSIWSCGCASGQEVYSILISLKTSGLLDEWQVNVVGTDFSAKALSIASRGVYTNFEAQTGNNIKTIVNNFIQKDYGWQVKPELMKFVEFRRYNLLDNLLFKNEFDIVFCRNILNRYTIENQREIIKKIRSAQSVGGLLYLGLGESVDNLFDYYEKVFGFECLYQAKSFDDKKES